MFSTVAYEVKGDACYITLNCPPGNVLSEAMAGELREACCRVNQDKTIRVVLIGGAGQSFCLGSELKHRLEDRQSSRDGVASLVARFSVCGAIASIDRPVLAAINGDALGAGLEIALACDIRIASAKAHFGFPDVGLGLLPADGGTQRLPRIIGRGRGLEMVLIGDVIDAGEALEAGLVSRVVPAGELSAEVEKWVEKVRSQAPVALRYGKEAVNKGLDLTLEQGLRLEADLYFLLHTTRDRSEGIAAFLQKRKAEFRGE